MQLLMTHAYKSPLDVHVPVQMKNLKLPTIIYLTFAKRIFRFLFIAIKLDLFHKFIILTNEIRAVIVTYAVHII